MKCYSLKLGEYHNSMKNRMQMLVQLLINLILIVFWGVGYRASTTQTDHKYSILYLSYLKTKDYFIALDRGSRDSTTIVLPGNCTIVKLY